MVAGLYWLFAIAGVVADDSVRVRLAGEAARHHTSVRVVVVGDAGGGTEHVARGIARVDSVDAIILTGDNFYPCGVRSAGDPKWAVLKPLMSLGIPVYPVLGNHDHCGNADAQIGAAFPNWIFPAREYVIETPVASFVMIDTTPFAKSGTSPPAIHRFTGAPWRIVVGHHPLLSSGYHGYLPRDEHRRMLRLVPDMREARVDLYICGHDHHLELLDANPRMLVSGAGSNPIPAVIRRGATRWVSQEPFRGFAILELTAKTMTIRFHDEKGDPRSEPFTYSR